MPLGHHADILRLESPVLQSLRYVPPPPLSAFVECLWYRRGQQPHSRRNRALPTGAVDLAFDLTDRGLRVFADARDAIGSRVDGAIVHGPQSRYFVLDARPDVHVVGVHFRVGCGALLLGVPASELADRHVALADVWGPAAISLRERLLDAPTPQAKLAVLEHALVARIRDLRRVHPAISFALRGFATHAGATQLRDLHEATGYGPRRFTTLFADAVGMAPKRYGRIVRLQRLVETAAAQAQPDWAALAAAHGYYDQSHLNRDFLALSGVTPARYRPLPKRPLHMNLDPDGAG